MDGGADMDRSAYLDACSNSSALAYTPSHGHAFPNGHALAHSDSYTHARANSHPGPS